MNTLKTIKIYACLLPVVLGFFCANQVKAQDLVKVEFERTPLFSEANIVPGESITRWTKVKNESSENEIIAVRASYFNDVDNLGDVMSIAVKEGGNSYYFDTLAGFFNTGEVILSEVLPGEEKQYDFTVSFLSDSDNSYQGKAISFDLEIGSQATESIGQEKPSGGGGYVYKDLIIYNEGAVVNNNSAIISWVTNKAATSRVIYDTVSHPSLYGEYSPNYGYAYSTIEDINKVTGHSVNIDNLLPNTTYFFRPLSKASPEQYGEEVSFTTTDSGEFVKVLGEEGTPELRVSKSCDTDLTNPGDENVICEIIVTNIGSLTAYNVNLEDTFSEGLLDDDVDKIKHWNLGDIAPGEFKSTKYAISISETAATGTYTNVVKAYADNHDLVSTQSFLSVESVEVLGSELVPTGFSLKELLLILAALIILVILTLFIKNIIRK